MAIYQQIGDLPTPPSRVDQPDEFTAKADAFLSAFPDLQAEINTWASEANTTQVSINSQAQAASTAKASANAAKASEIASSNNYVNTQTITNALLDTQHGIAQLGFGFAGLDDGDLIINYVDPVLDVFMVDGELHVTF